MSLVECLADRYRAHLEHAWNAPASAAERVWFAVYPPTQERRLRAYRAEFETVTRQTDCTWKHVDITDCFATWLGELEYRDAYFAAPELLEPALEEFGGMVCDQLTKALKAAPAKQRTVVALSGVGSLFGLVRVSTLIEKLTPAIQPDTRLLVFFPGSHEEHTYRLLDARDGWDYLAVPIKC